MQHRIILHPSIIYYPEIRKKWLKRKKSTTPRKPTLALFSEICQLPIEKSTKIPIIETF